jgi:hypothetical protein
MRILFYFVHPAKFHLFRVTINELKKNNTIDIIINSKDVLEELIKKEGWDYTNIFPKGRNISNRPSIIKSGFKFLLTLFRLEKYLLKRKKYDIFISDDSLVVNGWFHNVTSYLFNDNDIETIKFNKILFYFASKIICPERTNIAKFSHKKIAFKGNKALAHLHPKYFKRNEQILKKYNLLEYKYGIIRLSKINATHDFGNRGITDEDLEILFEMSLGNCNILISSERKIPQKYSHYLFKGEPSDMPNLIAFAKYFITDSATMASEAALIGTPNVLINNLGKKCSVNVELHENELQYYFDDFIASKETIRKIVESGNSYNDEFRLKSANYIKKCDDLNELFIALFSNKTI